MPVLIVGGQPNSAVVTLLNSGKYTLVSINSQELSSKKEFYISNTLNYTLGGKLISIPSVGVQAYLVGVKFRSKKSNRFNEYLAQCIHDSVYDLADDFDTHANWKSVANMRDKKITAEWSYFKIKDDDYDDEDEY